MYRVLLIEDEYHLLENLAENLTFEGFEVYTAENGWAGVNAALEHQPDIVVCDLMMPELDGHGVLLELRSRPSTSDIPFIFLTARAGLDDMRIGMNLGADDYLAKPCPHDTLVNTINARMAKYNESAGRYERTMEILETALTQEYESSQLKTRLLSMVAHDLRTGLTSILSSEQLIKNYQQKLSPERHLNYLLRIERNVHQMLTMLDDLLMVGEQQAGRVVTQIEQFDLRHLSRDIISDLSSMYGDTHPIEFMAQNGNTMIEADPRYISRILMNLLGNAYKYSEEGTTITVTIRLQDDTIQLIVEDRGIGIPTDDLEGLFDLYKRAGNVGGVRGKGIGLAVVKQAVDMHHGTIEVESAESVGTTFTITLPRHYEGSSESNASKELNA
ncbi:MAG: response regulator [Anaerolineae bacterium]|nr:response regulator [Anaerolineae bacterium]